MNLFDLDDFSSYRSSNYMTSTVLYLAKAYREKVFLKSVV